MEPLEPAQNQPPTYATSYRARVLERDGLRDVDPHIYVYSTEFARRFQMPEEWISDELTGAEAAAFRMVPAPKSCGWNGDLNNCREDGILCELDLYFDSNKHQLPWDARARISEMNLSKTSAKKIASIANRKYRPASTIFSSGPRLPFVDIDTGKELDWQMASSISIGWAGTLAYDREIFEDISMVTLFSGCGNVEAVWLSDVSINWERDKASPHMAHLVEFPTSWRVRIDTALKVHKERDHAFYKREGEKALKAIHESRGVATPVVPLE